MELHGRDRDPRVRDKDETSLVSAKGICMLILRLVGIILNVIEQGKDNHNYPVNILMW